MPFYIRDNNGAPDATFDNAAGYVIGDQVRDTSQSPPDVHECVDNTNGAAQWRNLSAATQTASEVTNDGNAPGADVAAALDNLAGGNLRTQVGSGSLGADDGTVLLDTSGGALSLALPSPSVSRHYAMKKTTADANTITVTRTTPTTVEGSDADFQLPGSDDGTRQAWSLIYDQPNDAWWVL